MGVDKQIRDCEGGRLCPGALYFHFLSSNGQFQCLAKFLLKHEKQNPSPQLKRAYQK